VPQGIESCASCIPLVSVDTSHQNEQQNSQLPHESSSTENYLNSGAEERQQVTVISK